MKILTTAIIKGGAGKTTTAVALAQAAKHSGASVLAIDLDPQANLSTFLGADPRQPGAYQLLHGESPAAVIQTTEQAVDVIAANIDLATEKTKAGSIKRLGNALEPLKKDYQLVIIDTPPQMGELTFNALHASTGLIIPLETDPGSLQGLYQIAGIAEQIRESNPSLEILGTLITKYDKRAKINRRLQETIASNPAEGVPHLGEIRAGIAIREAQTLRVSLYDYAPRSNPARDYMALYKKIMEG